MITRIQILAALLGVVLFTSKAHSEPIKISMNLGGLPDTSMRVNGTSTLLPQGMSFLINVDTDTADTWSPTDFGLFPATSVFVTIPDLELFNVRVTTKLAYMEDFTPGERAGLSPLFPDSGVDVILSTAGNTEIGNPNVIDTHPSMFGTGVMSGPFRMTLETGDVLANEHGLFGPSTLRVVPEPSSIFLAVLGLVGVMGFGRRRRKR